MEPTNSNAAATLSVLVVEDDPHLRAALKLWLEARGHRARCCEEGLQALEDAA